MKVKIHSFQTSVLYLVHDLEYWEYGQGTGYD
jgi:hypothetical protein